MAPPRRERLPSPRSRLRNACTFGLAAVIFPSFPRSVSESGNPFRVSTPECAAGFPLCARLAGMTNQFTTHLHPRGVSARGYRKARGAEALCTPALSSKKGAERLRCRYGILGARARTSQLASPPRGYLAVHSVAALDPHYRDASRKRPLVNRGNRSVSHAQDPGISPPQRHRPGHPVPRRPNWMGGTKARP
jgi:hypothetical protein